MRRFRFAFVSHSNQVAASVARGANPKTEELHLNLATMEKAIPVARELLDQGVEAVIGGGGTGQLLASRLGRSVVTLSRSSLEMLLALTHAREKSRDVGLTSFGSPVEGSEVYEKLLSLRIRPIVFSSSEELDDGIARVVADGCRIVVGGGICRDLAATRGAEGILIVPSRENVVRTLEEARAVARARRKERHDAEELRSVLGAVAEGLIVLDGNERITMFNDAAGAVFRSILGRVEPKDLVGQRLTREFEALGLRGVLQSGLPRVDRLCRVGAIEVSVAVQPIVVAGEIVGVFARVKEPIARMPDGKPARPRSGKGFVARYTLDQICGGPALGSMIAKARRYAQTDAAILIEGETGTGKELLAQGLHIASKRGNRPFLAVNCSALPESLLESELFGYEDGAFTGARRGGRAGLFELANHGTLFLDEIADISPNLQVRLLRALEEGEIMRLGGERIVPVDVRIIGSSQRDLFAAAREGRFRLDLYFRLATLRLAIPPLRARLEDLPVLTQVLLAKHGCRLEAIPSRLVGLLRDYTWPGNVRELESLVRTYVALADDALFDQSLFIDIFHEQRSARQQLSEVSFPRSGADSGQATLKQQLKRHEEEIIRKTMERCRYNRTETAKALGISINSLWRKTQRRAN